MPERNHKACQPSALFAGKGGRTNGGRRQQDAQPHDNDRGNENPDGGDASEDAGLPQGQAGAKDQNEVADEVNVDEPHYCSLTTRAARRFRRRVSSRALSYFGRSSP